MSEGDYIDEARRNLRHAAHAYVSSRTEDSELNLYCAGLALGLLTFDPDRAKRILAEQRRKIKKKRGAR